MAKEKVEEVANVAGTVATIESNDGKVVDVADLLKQMESADIGQELGSDYFTLEPGEEQRVIITKMTEMNKMGGASGEMIDAVNLIGSDGRQKICADRVLVSVSKGLAKDGKLPCPVQITCTGTKKTAKGTYKEFTVNQLLLK